MTTLATLLEDEDRTAVERFAALHDDGALPVAERTYRSLVPATPPGPGQQYTFAVDLDSCTGCKSCVVACSSLNGLDADESWRSVGLLRSAEPVSPLQQTVSTACHHCVEPACLQGCPVDAYEKDPITGIVAHLDDQCIGCGYCTWTCPYEVPRFNETRGIVRKCDMCKGRLEVGEAPACVQSCPTGAISIDVVDVEELRASTTATATLVPGAPVSSRTVPTTVYLTKRPAMTDLVAADHDTVRPAHAHPPLALMLVLTQVAVGAVAVDAALRALRSADLGGGRGAGWLGACMGVLALAASIGHLGRPRYAFRAVLGFGHSWLSREVVALGVFGALSVGAAAASVVAPGEALPLASSGLAAAVGIAGVVCSVMVYAVCGRRWWSLASTARRFGLTTIAGGLAANLAVASATGASPDLARVLAAASAVAIALKLVTDAAIVVHAPRDTELARTSSLLRGELATATRLRFALGGAALAAAVLVPVADGTASALVAAIALVLLVGGELVERSLFFTAEAGPRMPGARP